jgi:excisionase family DNA binding protein
MSRKNPPEEALYVKLPATAVEKLNRASESLGIAKKDLVAGLVGKYVDPDSPRGLGELGQLSQPRLGSYSFQAYELPEVLTPEQAALFLQVPEATVVELADKGQLPGRKLGSVWRFSRAALVAWLASPR